jgi:hypothetical protein
MGIFGFIVREKVEINRSGTADIASRYMGILASALLIFSIGIRNLKGLGLGGLWKQGLGSIDPNAVFTSSNVAGNSAGILQDTVLVNLPQLLLSILYFLFNGMFTCMMAGREWSLFGSQRMTLRVSSPRHQQRSTYWLQLPWTYSIPLIALSSVIHWLVSRSLFLVRILVFDHNNVPEPDRNVLACGYSPLAILVVIAALLVMMIILLVCSRRPLPPGAPIVGTCSWAISAACHRPSGDADAAFKAVKWGVTEPGSVDRPGHCCLTSHEVQRPVIDCLYM